jgi:cytoskeletal protein CcmA (bactofilin family)
MIRQLIVATLASSTAWSVALADDAGTSKVMGAVDIAPGQHAGEVSTVNGSIHIGENAVVGHTNTVNGSVTLERRATAAELTTVNGSVHVRDEARVTGQVHSVNGALSVDNGADVKGDLGNVNGGILVAAAHVGGSIDTTTGGITLGPNAHIDGNVTMQKDSSWFHFGFQEIPRVVIGPGTVVKGRLRFERKVALYVSDHATIGPVEGATVVKFSGNSPPQ